MAKTNKVTVGSSPSGTLATMIPMPNMALIQNPSPLHIPMPKKAAPSRAKSPATMRVTVLDFLLKRAQATFDRRGEAGNLAELRSRMPVATANPPCVPGEHRGPGEHQVRHVQPLSVPPVCIRRSALRLQIRRSMLHLSTRMPVASISRASTGTLFPLFQQQHVARD